ncbi:MAG: TlpA family protein disulfide reductase [Nannocystaceae bacterium]|nr:TlpA family protein disulfide reductase [Nannocystaceae bacterium]
MASVPLPSRRACLRAGLGAGVGLLFAPAPGCRRQAPTQPPAADGTLALQPPDAVFQQTVAGHVAVIDFWATWCEPCRTSIPKVIAFARQSRERGVVVVGMHVGHGFEQALQFAADSGIDYPLFADPDYRVSDRYAARRVPTVLALGRDGAVLYRGDEVDDGLRRAVDAAL